MREVIGCNVQRPPTLTGRDELSAYIDWVNVSISSGDINICQLSFATNDFKNMYTCLP